MMKHTNHAVYIHIPFCKTICTYCDFCKLYYKDSLVDEYLCSLELEIKTKYQGEEITTLYIGGGTPSSLSILQLERLFHIINYFNLKDPEITFECNLEIEEEKLQFLYDKKVNRISFGIESFDPENLLFLGRTHTKQDAIKKIKRVKQIGFSNINIDIIYGLPKQTVESVIEDIRQAKQLQVEHISTYSLIIEEHTKLFIEQTVAISEDLDYEMYQAIKAELKDFDHYEISNFAMPGYQSKHNQVYWNNENYYGFGLGAHGYIDNTRYANTRSLKNYNQHNYQLEETILTQQDQMEEHLILGLRLLEGIDLDKFKKRFKKNLIEVFDCSDNRLEIISNHLRIKEEYLYTMNDILINLL